METAVSFYNKGLQFRLYPLRFHFRAAEALRFPEHSAANVFRGALGWLLCETAGPAYAPLFEPQGQDGPSGLADPPRPFVIRAQHLDGCLVASGQEFHVGIPWFDLRPNAVAALIQAFRHWKRAEFLALEGDSPLALPLEHGVDRVDRVTVRFLTPTELKTAGGIAPAPEFGVLMARIRDRISTLRALYGGGPLEIDFREFARRAAQVHMSRCDIRVVEAARRSGRTGQVHSLGGFVGEAGYEGDLSEFLPYLRIAQWTGVGRQTVWGKGALELPE